MRPFVERSPMELRQSLAHLEFCCCQESKLGRASHINITVKSSNNKYLQIEIETFNWNMANLRQISYRKNSVKLWKVQITETHICNIQLKDGKYFCEDMKIKQQVEIQIWNIQIKRRQSWESLLKTTSGLNFKSEQHQNYQFIRRYISQVNLICFLKRTK